MTQSKKDDTITINIDDYTTDIIDLSNIDGLTVSGVSNSATTYWAGDSVTDITFDSSTSDGTFTIDTNTMDTIDIDWLTGKSNINPGEVERMCKEYPALEKVWRNFKSVYDMVKQDYEGKKKSGEIDDENYPF